MTREAWYRGGRRLVEIVRHHFPGAEARGLDAWVAFAGEVALEAGRPDWLEGAMEVESLARKILIVQGPR